MKALIRNNREIVLEPFEGIDWTTGAPLTNPAWCGGPYALAEDAPADSIPSDFDIVEYYDTIREATEDEPAEIVTRRQAILNTARYEARKAQDGAEDAPAPETPAEGADGAEEPPATIIIDGVEYIRAAGE